MPVHFRDAPSDSVRDLQNGVECCMSVRRVNRDQRQAATVGGGDGVKRGLRLSEF